MGEAGASISGLLLQVWLKQQASPLPLLQMPGANRSLKAQSSPIWPGLKGPSLSFCDLVQQKEKHLVLHLSADLLGQQSRGMDISGHVLSPLPPGRG